MFSKHPDVFFVFADFNNNKKSNLLFFYINQFLKQKEEISLSQFHKIHCYFWFYFSAMDLNISFGYDNMKEVYEGKHSKLMQRRSLAGRITFPEYSNVVIILRDLYGLNKFGLSSLSVQYGLAA
jgi:hypothetical protein